MMSIPIHNPVDSNRRPEPIFPVPLAPELTAPPPPPENALLLN